MGILGLEPKVEKGVDLARSGGLLGVELVSGLSLLPKSKRLGVLLASLIALLSDPWSSPQAIQSYLGTLQWTCLLNRPLLSCFSRVYTFAESSPTGTPRVVPLEVLDEFAVCFHY